MERTWEDNRPAVPRIWPAWRPRTARAGVELTSIAAFLIGVHAAAARSDPFGLELGFPWLVLAPWLVGIRHGTFPALASALGLGTSIGLWWFGAERLVSPERAWSVVLACVALAVIGGTCRDRARRRLEAATRAFSGLQERLERAERAQHELELARTRAAHSLELAQAGAALELRASRRPSASRWGRVG